MCQSRQLPTRHRGLRALSPNIPDHDVPAWIDFYCSRREWVEGYLSSVLRGTATIVYEDNKEERVSFPNSTRIQPLHSQTSNLLQRSPNFVYSVSQGNPCEFYCFSTKRWLKGTINGVDLAAMQVTVTPTDDPICRLFSVYSNHLLFPEDKKSQPFIKENVIRDVGEHDIKGNIFQIEQPINFKRQLMDQHGWKIHEIQNDGNCLFRAISHQVYGTEDHHNIIRGKCVDFLLMEKAFFKSFVVGGDSAFTSHCARMRQDRVWGDHLEIQALSELYNRPIEIYEDGSGPSAVKTFKCTGDDPPIRISYHQQSHYNSIIPQTLTLETPPGEVEEFGLARPRRGVDDALQKALKESDIEATDAESLKTALENSEALSDKPKGSTGTDDFFNRVVQHCVKQFGFTTEETVQAYSCLGSSPDVLKGKSFEEVVEEVVAIVFSSRRRTL